MRHHVNNLTVIGYILLIYSHTNSGHNVQAVVSDCHNIYNSHHNLGILLPFLVSFFSLIGIVRDVMNALSFCHAVMDNNASSSLYRQLFSSCHSKMKSTVVLSVPTLCVNKNPDMNFNFQTNCKLQQTFVYIEKT